MLTTSSGIADCLTPRRSFCLATLSFILPACKGRTMRVYLDVSLFNYLDRPIFDVMLNNTHLMGAPARGFYGENAVIAMQPVILGAQAVSWRLDGPEGLAGNGNTVIAKNKPMLHELPDGVRRLGLHIYPDDMVEIKLGKGGADDLQTERGRKIIEAWEAKQNDG